MHSTHLPCLTQVFCGVRPRLKNRQQTIQARWRARRQRECQCRDSRGKPKLGKKEEERRRQTRCMIKGGDSERKRDARSDTQRKTYTCTLLCPHEVGMSATPRQIRGKCAGCRPRGGGGVLEDARHGRDIFDGEQEQGAGGWNRRDRA